MNRDSAVGERATGRIEVGAHRGGGLRGYSAKLVAEYFLPSSIFPKKRPHTQGV